MNTDNLPRDEHGRQPLDFRRPLTTSHTPPRNVVVLPDQPLVTQRNRVAVSGNSTLAPTDMKNWADLKVTVWHYDAYGNCGTADRSPSPLDLQYATGGAS